MLPIYKLSFPNGSYCNGVCRALWAKSLTRYKKMLWIQMQALKTTAYYISPIEIGLLWAKITYLKSHSKALAFDLLTDMKLWSRSFIWGTVGSCRSRGCKNIRGQSWRLIRNCRFETDAPGARLIWQIFFDLQLPDIFAASWPTRVYSTPFERYD